MATDIGVIKKPLTRHISACSRFGFPVILGLAFATACSAPDETNTSLLDVNQDGVADDLGEATGSDFDLDGDGILDGPGIDTDGDGLPDSIGIDSDGDGIIDSLDTDGDGVIDVVTGPDGTGGTNPATGGTDPGTGGTDPATGGTDPGTGGADAATGGVGSDLPAYCDPTLAWQAESVGLELEVLAIVNQERAKGATCGGEVMPSVGALSMDDSLQCAARMHSLDMNLRSFFDHSNPDGDSPGDRMDAAGYTGNSWGENIATGDNTAAGVMTGWMSSPGHCKNIMNGKYTLIGIGHYPGGTWGHLWTQTFGG